MMHMPPVVASTTSCDTDDSEDPVIRLKLDKPANWNWQLTTTSDVQPIIQLLDKDGRVLVETAGRVAQRARGSFGDGLKTHEIFPNAQHTVSRHRRRSRSNDGYNTKLRPRKSRSAVNISIEQKERKSRKRHSSVVNATHTTSTDDESHKSVRRYSAGDFLRHQIVENLRKQNGILQSPDDFAKTMCKKVKRYVRSQSDSAYPELYINKAHDDDLETPNFQRPVPEIHNNVRPTIDGINKNNSIKALLENHKKSGSLLQKEDIDKIRQFLTQRIQAKMKEEMMRGFPVTNNCQPNQMKHSSVHKNINSSPHNYIGSAETHYRPRKVRSIGNINAENYGKSYMKASQVSEPCFSPLPTYCHQKCYRKCRSDIPFDHFNCNFKIEKENFKNYTPRKIKSQDSIGKSKFEHQERMKEKEMPTIEQDFMKLPRWRDIQNKFCSTRNCRICENKTRCYVPEEKHKVSNVSEEPKESDPEMERPETSLQENYLVIEEPAPVEARVFSKVQVNGIGYYGPNYSDKVTNRRRYSDFCENYVTNTRGMFNGNFENRHNAKDKASTIKQTPGEDVVFASPASTGRRDAWKVYSSASCRPQRQEDSTSAKRPRHPAPPPPGSNKTDLKDTEGYYENSNTSNKENRPQYGVNQQQPYESGEERAMGSNLSRHSGKGLNGRRAQSSGNLCDAKGNSVGKILMPCSSASRESRYKFCGSLPNHLDGKESLDDEPGENNNVISDTIGGNLGGTLPHKKKHVAANFSDDSTNTLDLVRHRSEESLEDDPWRYRDDILDLVKGKPIELVGSTRRSNFGENSYSHGVDVVDGEHRRAPSSFSARGRLNGKGYPGSDLDLVGTLPKRRQDSTKRSAPSLALEHRNCAIDRINDDMLLNIVHKPDCELMRYRRFNRLMDLKLNKMTGSEPQDQGYASERSPEEEHPPSFPDQPFPTDSPDNTFRVTLKKSSRGLGLSVSGGGTAGPVRVKRLFPQQPAALSNKLQSGDILLAANGIPLTGLTNYEALEVLRTTSSTVELVVCRLPGDTSVTPPGAPPPPPPARKELPPLKILNPLPPLEIEPCGEFDIEMTKVAGSLGFTLRKADSSALGHYVRALVREPALSDGRIQPGDKIVAVDGATLSPMSHEEAVALLRRCGPRVKLRLYRDLAQTPVSALSPTEPDHPLRPPRTSLRQEAVDMLCDLAVRKLSPGTSTGSGSALQSQGTSCNSPRKLRRPVTRNSTGETEQGTCRKHNSHASTVSQETSDSDQCSIKTQITNSQPETPANDIIDPPPLYDVCDSSDSSTKAHRPSFLDLSAPPEKPHFQFSLDSEDGYTGPVIVTDSDSNIEEITKDTTVLSSDEQDTNLPSEPASMPPVLSSASSTSTAFSYKNPAYQSANPACGAIDGVVKSKISHSSDQDIPGKVLGDDDPGGSKGLLKWKGVMFAPNDGNNSRENINADDERDAIESAILADLHEQGHEVFMVELTRGWNSRLGFSLQPSGNNTVISVVHPDSVASKDGRLKQGDVLIMINDESVENMSTADIIDLLRKIRGSIGITVLRYKDQNSAC